MCIRDSFGSRNNSQILNAMKVTGNWMLQSIHFMEDGQVADVLLDAANGTATDEQMQLAVRTPITSLYCPTRREPQAYPLTRRHAEAYGDLGARTDYAINGGSSTETGAAEGDGRLEIIELAHDGIWAIGRKTELKKITDGLSKSYLVGEKSMDASKYTTGDDHGDRACIAGLVDNFGAANSYVRFAARLPDRDTVENCTSCHDYGSAHHSVWNSTMADGSVRSLDYGMDILCLLYTSPSPRDLSTSRMPSSA